MLARVTAATPWGLEALPVDVEADVRTGLPQMQLVGLPDASVRESQERVRSAIRNSGFELPPRSIVVNLAPADVRKKGNHLDLAIALALLGALEQIPADALDGRLVCGELALDGSIRDIRGGLAVAELAARKGVREVLLPATTAGEAAAHGEVVVRAVTSLRAAVDHLLGERVLAEATEAAERPAADQASDLADVRGQGIAKRALEIAAAGGHNLLLIGAPGSGKSMLAARLPGILPALTRREAVAVTKIHSSVGLVSRGGLLRQRPFRAPHHGASAAALVGGGHGVPRPGEISLAHHGVLFLDELPEFQRNVLESLRQPLEEGWIRVSRAQGSFRFPARFALLAAMNPCKCGWLGDDRRECVCPPGSPERYRQKVSGPLLDRIDLRVAVRALDLAEVQAPPGEPSASVRERVVAARERQRARMGDAGPGVNAGLDGPLLRRFCSPDRAGQALLERAFERLGLSMRAVTRVLRVARTIADLAADEDIVSRHVAEALQYREA